MIARRTPNHLFILALYDQITFRSHIFYLHWEFSVPVPQARRTKARSAAKQAPGFRIRNPQTPPGVTDACNVLLRSAALSGLRFSEGPATRSSAVASLRALVRRTFGASNHASHPRIR